jgi:hypothetical protein
MNRSSFLTKRLALLSAGLLSAVTMTGCQVDVGGQTLPSATYLSDDIQYFPTGPKFKLTQEAAAMKAYSEQQAQFNQGPFPPAGPGQFPPGQFGPGVAVPPPPGPAVVPVLPAP